MGKEYIISIIVPVYNTQKYLRKCLDSICVQTCKMIQVVIIDDGSNDGSENICDEYDDKFEDVLVVHQKNCGLVASRKIGIEVSAGRYIAFVDADDWIDGDFFLRVVEFLVDEKIDIVAFDCIKEFQNGSFKWGNEIKSGMYSGRCLDVIKENAIFRKAEFVPWVILPNLWAKIIDKKLISNFISNVSDSITYGEDAACFYPCLWNSSSMLVLKEAPYHYLQREESMSNKFKKIDNRIIEEIIECLCKSPYMNREILNQIKLYKFYLYFLCNYNWFDRYGMTVFPFEKIDENDKIVIYGAGGLGKSILDYVKSNHRVRIQAIVDIKGNACSIEGYKVSDVKEITKIDFDYIIIAILNETISKEVRKSLVDMGVNLKKILYINKECLLKYEEKCND